MRRILFLLLFLWLVLPIMAQQPLSVIRANAVDADVRDGGKFRQKAWRISPAVKPDLYVTSVRNAEVTFYTDLDSISFTVEPGKNYDFIILLKGKDSALTRISYEQPKLELLKEGAAYNTDDKRAFPTFTYQRKEDPNLVALRKGLKLDSIAGTGSETLKILNLLHWIHNLIPHDGQNDNPAVRNAMSLIRTCKQEKRGLNCRGLAIVLNECYLALGIPSRYATCMPRDSVFDDCHVINLVYSSDNEKWLWIDPTNNAYVMDEQGQLLSIEEVRERLIHDWPLILNPDANWNNKSSAVKENYLQHYMAKNLYRIECPLESTYNYETWQKGKTVSYVELLPIDNYYQRPQQSRHVSAKTGTTFVNYTTNNPGLFWATPVVPD